MVQYGVFAAYHLALETSFLADEGASLPELPLNSPLTVALPDKPSNIDRSISTIPGFSVPATDKTQGPNSNGEPQRSNSVPTSDQVSRISNAPTHKTETTFLPIMPNAPSSQYTEFTSSIAKSVASFPSISSCAHAVTDYTGSESSPSHANVEKKIMGLKESSQTIPSVANNDQDVTRNCCPANSFGPPKAVKQGDVLNNSRNESSGIVANQNISNSSSFQQDVGNVLEEPCSSKEEFPPSPSDHQSILVSLSSRCVWKGTVCERSHLFRIKYYGNFDKPLGRFLRDNLFDQVLSLFLLCFYVVCMYVFM